MIIDMVKLHHDSKVFEVQASTVLLLAQVLLEAQAQGADSLMTKLRQEIKVAIKEFNRKIVQNRTTLRDRDIADIQIAMLAATDIVEGMAMVRGYIRERVTDGGVEDHLELTTWINQLIHGERTFYGITIEFDPAGGAPKLVSDDRNPKFFIHYHNQRERGPAELEPSQA